MSDWEVSLPMYALTEPLKAANRALLEAFIGHLGALGWRAPVRIVEPDFAHIDEHWRHPRLLMSQTCGYPLMTRLKGQVRLLAIPSYHADGFERTRYASRLIVREGSGIDTLNDLKGHIAAINSEDSHSGMNALRHAVAPLASAGRFFAQVVVTGGHAASIESVRDGHADVAAIDPVTWACLLDARPDLALGLRTLGWTAAAPGLPLISSRQLPPQQAEWVKSALAQALQGAPELAQRLRLQRIHPARWGYYHQIVDMQRQAQARGVTRLAH